MYSCRGASMHCAFGLKFETLKKGAAVCVNGV